jgi:hypothetical protein
MEEEVRMLVETRKTAAGIEYWDTELKKVVIGGVDLATGPDKTVINTREPGDGKNLEDMTIKELHAFAEQVEVDIPSDIKKKEDIIKFLIDSK